MKKIFNYLTTFKVGRVDPYMFTVILCLLCVNAMLWQPLVHEAKAADNANLPDYTLQEINPGPFHKVTSNYWQGTVFATEVQISIDVGEDWTYFEYGYEYAADNWYVGTAYTYEDLVFDDNSLAETFHMPFTFAASTTGEEWFVRGFKVDGAG